MSWPRSSGASAWSAASYGPGGTEREWCDPDVLRRLRRVTLARLRRDVEPADQAALGRFLPAWHGIDRGASLREALVPLQSLPLPVSLWESEVLPRRVRGYNPAALDALCASGELVWVGAGLDRVAVFYRDDASVLGAPAAAPAPEGPAAVAIRAALDASAEFWPDLLVASGLEAEEALPALWELVWAGEVTNDAWTPLRAERRYGVPRQERRPRRFSRTRGAGTTSTAGRWALAARLFQGDPDRRALAELLLERQGIVTRDGVRGEGIAGGYGAVYAELRALETIGSCRRGYFVDGLGGAQFALPGAVERLRELRSGDDSDALVLAAADPAQPYGSALPWPKRCRSPGGARRRRSRRPARWGGGALRRARRPHPRAVARAFRRLAARGARRPRRLGQSRPRETACGRALRRAAGRGDRRDESARGGRLPRRPEAGGAATVALRSGRRRPARCDLATGAAPAPD